MYDNTDKIATELLEISSEQRLKIILNLLEKNSKLSELAKIVNATTQEIHRNLDRLSKARIVQKDSDGFFCLSTYGKTVCKIFPLVNFLSQNKEYFRKHDFGNLPDKFIVRLGSLSNGNYIKGVSIVLEKWKEIIENANEYVFGIVYEYPLELVRPIVTKAKNGIKVNSIFYKSAIIPKGRKKLVEQLDLSDLIKEKKINRKIIKNIPAVIMLNEKEASVNFHSLEQEIDMSSMFYSTDPKFHEWCLDYFRYCWYGSESFDEKKLNR